MADTHNAIFLANADGTGVEYGNTGGGGGGSSADAVSYDNTTSGLSATDVQDAIDEVASLRVIKVTTTSFSSLPQTIQDPRIKSTHEVIHSVLSNPAAQTADNWTVTTSDGSLQITGTISGSTTLTLYLANIM